MPPIFQAIVFNPAGLSHAAEQISPGLSAILGLAFP
jgi:hypothetical protein